MKYHEENMTPFTLSRQNKYPFMPFFEHKSIVVPTCVQAMSLMLRHLTDTHKEKPHVCHNNDRNTSHLNVLCRLATNGQFKQKWMSLFDASSHLLQLYMCGVTFVLTYAIMVRSIHVQMQMKSGIRDMDKQR